MKVLQEVGDVEAKGEVTVGQEARARIVRAASDLLTSGGRDALTTRAVAMAAGVQSPTIYRMFGDKEGLIEAVAESGFERYLQQKGGAHAGSDPVENLRVGWDLHVEFGLANPALYSLMYGEPRPGVQSRAAAAAFRILHEHIRRIAVAGRLKVSEERAAHLVHASGCGAVFTLLALPADQQDKGIALAAREATIAAITTTAPLIERPRPATLAIALRALLPEVSSLTSGERQLLTEWLDRLAQSEH
jgi:AcrR family transcriptional regulator